MNNLRPCSIGDQKIRIDRKIYRLFHTFANEVGITVQYSAVVSRVWDKYQALILLMIHISYKNVEIIFFRV